MQTLNPTLQFLAPAQTTCNYIALWFRNISSLLSEGDANGTWQRFIIVATPQGPNNEGGPSVGAGGRADAREPPAHEPVPEHGGARASRSECEAGNEPYLAGRTVTSNVPGHAAGRDGGQALMARAPPPPAGPQPVRRRA